MVEDASGRRCPHRRSAKPSRPPGRGLSAIEALRRTILRTGVGWTSRARVRTSTTAQVVGVTSERKGLSPFSTDQTPLPRARYHRHAWLEFQRALDPLGTPKPRPPSALSVLRLRGVRRAMSQSEQVESLPQTRPRAERRPPEKSSSPLRPPTFASQQPAWVKQPPVEISGASGTLGADETQLRPGERSATRLRAADVLALDRVGPLSCPLAVVDPQNVADDVVVAVDRLDQGEVEEFASRFLALAASSDPGLALASDEQATSLRRVGSPLFQLAPPLRGSLTDPYPNERSGEHRVGRVLERLRPSGDFES